MLRQELKLSLFGTWVWSPALCSQWGISCGSLCCGPFFLRQTSAYSLCVFVWGFNLTDLWGWSFMSIMITCVSKSWHYIRDRWKLLFLRHKFSAHKVTDELWEKQDVCSKLHELLTMQDGNVSYWKITFKIVTAFQQWKLSSAETIGSYARIATFTPLKHRV